MGQIIWRFSNEKAQWEKKEAGKEGTADALLYLDGREYQTMHGFGGCLNELGWQGDSPPTSTISIPSVIIFST